MAEFDVEMQQLSPQLAENYGGGTRARQLLQPAILVIQFIQMLLAKCPISSRVSSSQSNAEQDENARYEDDEVVVESDLLPDYKLDSRMSLRRRVKGAVRSYLAFKAPVASCASEQPEVAETTINLLAAADQLPSIVRQKNLSNFIDFGGLDKAKHELGTDFVKGLSEKEALKRNARSLDLAPTQTFLHILLKEVIRITFLLLLLSVILTIFFHFLWVKLALKQPYELNIVPMGIILGRVIAAIWKYWLIKYERNKLQNYKFLESKEEQVRVTRGGKSKFICVTNLVWGDILLLANGDKLPCDGLFIDGESLELDCSSASRIINEQNPFLLYDERVINGHARIAVTSTRWSEMIDQGRGDPNTMLTLENQLENVGNVIDTIQDFISFVLFLVSLIWNNVGIEDVTAGTHFAEENVKEATWTGNSVITTLQSATIIGGLIELAPFVVALANCYWNRKALSGKGMTLTPNAVSKTAHITRFFISTSVIDQDRMEDTNAKLHALREPQIEIGILSSEKMSVAEDIARGCGVLSNDDLESSVITGEEFRNCPDEKRLQTIGNIHVLAEASSYDKSLFVETLKKKGEVVTFLGRNTDDAPALKTADIGIAMGTLITKKAAENSDIILSSDESFADLISIVDSGKCLHNNIQCYLQYVLTTYISSELICIIETQTFGAASLTSFQLRCLYLAFPVLGGLALLTKPSIGESGPTSCKGSIISEQMTINILFQVLYQAVCSVVTQLKGSALVGPSQDMKIVASTLFIFFQFFNLFIAREMQHNNFIRGIQAHKEFWIATVLYVALFIVHVILGYGTIPEWKILAYCVVFAVLLWLVDFLGKCVARITI